MKDIKPNSKSANRQQGFLQTLLSTCAAAFGVQTQKNHERDFTQGNIKSYIAAGIVFTVIFVVLIFAGVRLVLKVSGVES